MEMQGMCRTARAAWLINDRLLPSLAMPPWRVFGKSTKNFTYVGGVFAGVRGGGGLLIA